MEKERNRKDERNYKKKLKRKLASQARGITLVALVITIIIIIILATVTIRFAFGNDGIIKRAELAKDMYANDTAYTDQSMANATAYLDEMLNGTTGGSGTDEPEVPVQTATTVAEAKQNGLPFAEKTVITDGKDNKITIPKGFKIASDSGDTVQQGIVIEDVSASTDTAVQGSQYVWIPVGTFTKDDGTTSKEIKLGRYTFSTTSPGTPTLVQDAVNYTASTPINDSGIDYTEATTYDAGNESSGSDGRNATAKNLGEFINSTKPMEEGGNGGYYIGRYEASYASGATSTTEVGDYANCKAASKISTAYRTYEDGSMSYNPGTLWNFITQPAASEVAINTYEDSDSVKSDLINSYAWDTAIVYIQEAGNANYANETRKHNSLSNTGNLAEGVKDEVCKINDMASNVYEWTTEHSSLTLSSNAFPCVNRGGFYNASSNFTAFRNNGYATYSLFSIGFRLSLYVK